ncbi:MAG: VWA domain-containing protein [Brumimicrobium sp.]|nr:VWA domain-containing protein [Brumimicrobium sp.]
MRFWEYLHINILDYQFYAKQWLWLLLITPIILYLRYRWTEQKRGEVKFSNLSKDLKSISYKPASLIQLLIYTSLAVGMSSLIIAMALPTLPYSEESSPQYSEGIDIVIAMDISGSMMATDFLPNRLEVAKKLAQEFIDKRPQDKIGFVVFEGEAYTTCPTTKNHSFLKSKIEEIQSGNLLPGTAIGVGLGTAVARLRSDTIESKVVILLTDGENNRGDLLPMDAAQIAKNKNIRVYTIGIGQKGVVKMPIDTPFGRIMQDMEVNIDEDLLTKMADMTGGEYFRATDENSLKDIYGKIDQMEKSKIVENHIEKEPPYTPTFFLLLGVVTLILGFFTEHIVFKKND